MNRLAGAGWRVTFQLSDRTSCQRKESPSLHDPHGSGARGAQRGFFVDPSEAKGRWLR